MSSHTRRLRLVQPGSSWIETHHVYGQDDAHAVTAAALGGLAGNDEGYARRRAGAGEGCGTVDRHKWRNINSRLMMIP